MERSDVFGFMRELRGSSKTFILEGLLFRKIDIALGLICLCDYSWVQYWGV